MMVTARGGLCGVRDHALGGRARNGEFLLAIAIARDGGAPSWPRFGTQGWCGAPDEEVQRLVIVRITISRIALNGKRELLCQHCSRMIHAAHQGDLFSVAA